MLGTSKKCSRFGTSTNKMSEGTSVLHEGINQRQQKYVFIIHLTLIKSLYHVQFILYINLGSPGFF